MDALFSRPFRRNHNVSEGQAACTFLNESISDKGASRVTLSVMFIASNLVDKVGGSIRYIDQILSFFYYSYVVFGFSKAQNVLQVLDRTRRVTNYLSYSTYSTAQFFLFRGQRTRQTNKNSPPVTVLTRGVQNYGEKSVILRKAKIFKV